MSEQVAASADHATTAARAAALLGLPGVLAQIAEHCAGEEGRRQVLASRVHTDPQAVLAERAPGVELRRLMEAGFHPPELHLPEIGASLGRLRRGASSLDPAELAAIGRLATTSEAIRAALSEVADRDERPALSELCAELPVLGSLGADLRRVVSVDGTIQDHAVPELARVKRDLRRLQLQIETAAGELIADPALRGCFNGTMPTQRGGRTVVPLKATHRARVAGVVHEVSASGATIYVEPLRDVEANNAVVAARDRYAAEVRRVLHELTAMVARKRPDLERAEAVTARFDCVQARARYARAHGATTAPVGPLALHQARHPELGSAAVPLNLTMDPDARIMIITGPNTGGKTVCLKTVGLLCLMNQAGLEIPAAEDSTLPIYRGIFADIGDEQSIAESLSTFSAHIENLAAIMRDATARSLVLIDELGTGTDPEEGIALSRALLDRFRDAGSTVLATTHHGALKVYAYTESGVTNASMEFDPHTLRPTFHVIEGVPGESHAIDIARRHRMPAAVVDRAAELLDAGRTDAGRIINALTHRQQRQDREERSLRERAAELAEQEAELVADRAALQARERQHHQEAARELSRFLTAARRDVERAIREVRSSAAAAAADADAAYTAAADAPAADAAARAAPGAVAERLQAEREALAALDAATDPGSAADGEPLAPGSRVRIRRTGAAGRVVRQHRPDRYPDRYVVQTDTIRGEFRAAELDVSTGDPISAEQRPASGRGARFELVTRAEPVLELHVRGMRAEEALQEVERQLDAAIIRGWSQFAVVHGRGTGVLRQAIREYLRDSAAVSDVQDAPADEGGHGKTIVRLAP